MATNIHSGGFKIDLLYHSASTCKQCKKPLITDCNIHDLYIYVSPFAMGHFQVTLNLCFKTSPRTKPFIWKLV